MQLARNPLIVLALLYAAFLACLTPYALDLPARMASHFDFHGEPDGWMSGGGYLAFMAAFGLTFPLFLPGLFWITRRLPDGAMNLPHREYWLAPERRDETHAYLLRHALWLACMQMLLVIALHLLVVEANRQDPPRLSNAVWGLLFCFIAGIAAWLVTMIRHFGPPAKMSKHPVSSK